MARRVGVQVVLLPFFGPGALKTPAEMDYVGDLLRELGPQAEKAGVVLGLEDTISARDNVRIMERSQSPAVKTYYDVGNSIKQGFDIIEEIRWLGNDADLRSPPEGQPALPGRRADQLPCRHRRARRHRLRQVGAARDRLPVEGRAGRHDAEPGVRQRADQGAGVITTCRVRVTRAMRDEC